MPFILTLSGSPSPSSRTRLLVAHVGQRLERAGFDVVSLDVRDLPAEDLLHGRADSPAIRDALGLVERAQGIVVATPVYKAAYAGVLKIFLDVMPQLGLAEKIVLPLATGGSLAHVLMLDYALRPVLMALGARHVTTSLFLLDKFLTRSESGALTIDAEVQTRLEDTIDEFAFSVRRHHGAGTGSGHAAKEPSPR